MKVTIVGAASVTWMPIFLKDICNCKEMAGQQLVLHDIDTQRAEVMRQFCEKIKAERGAEFSVAVEPDLDRSIAGADAVICNVLVGGHQTWSKEIELIKSYGIAHPKGMSVGPGGMIMGITQMPFLLHLAKRMEQLCPQAWLLNYANPMQVLMLTLHTYSSIKSIGICHGVEHSIEKYCEWLGEDRKDIWVRWGGVNHFEIVMEMKKNGQDLFPALLEKMECLEHDGSEFGDLTTKEMLRIFGGLPSNHDIHSIEFYPHYLKRGTKLEDYRLKQNDVEVRICDGNKRYETIKDYIAGTQPLTELVKEENTEHIDEILHTIATNEPVIVAANIMNAGCISNLQPDISVGVPVVMYRDGYLPCNVGEMPEGLEAMQRLHGSIQQLVMKGGIEKNRQALIQAMTLDPMCYDLSAQERAELIDGLLEIAKPYIGEFQ